MTKSSVHKRLVDQLGLSFKPIESVSRSITIKNEQEILLSRKLFLQAIGDFDVKDFLVCGVSKFTGNLPIESAWLPK